ncbi:DUF1127 domain-containing protein [Kiloniella laminariae]|uniref:DUF1127 domain-containing protein n=1 Tax=Kiloniella laminariae TaxID=454162 RepID=UPI00036A777D|nr:DUF1127 domain-containing protein [Kiloniella laminariae]
MATVTFSETLPLNPTAGYAQRIGLSLGSLFISMIEAMEAYKLRRQTRIALYNCSDAVLEDIGLSRGDIEGIVSKL